MGASRTGEYTSTTLDADGGQVNDSAGCLERARRGGEKRTSDEPPSTAARLMEPCLSKRCAPVIAAGT